MAQRRLRRIERGDVVGDRTAEAAEDLRVGSGADVERQADAGFFSGGPERGPGLVVVVPALGRRRRKKDGLEAAGDICVAIRYGISVSRVGNIAAPISRGEMLMTSSKSQSL